MTPARTFESDRLPAAAFVLGLACLVEQLLALAYRGVSRADTPWVVLSMALGGLLVGWVSAGVLRARTGRLVVAWLLLGLTACLALVVAGLDVLDDATRVTGPAGLRAALSLVEVIALAAFCRSGYFRRRRAEAATGSEPSIAVLVLVAVLVGALGGLTATATHGGNAGVQIHLGL